MKRTLGLGPQVSAGRSPEKFSITFERMGRGCLIRASPIGLRRSSSTDLNTLRKFKRLLRGFSTLGESTTDSRAPYRALVYDQGYLWEREKADIFNKFVRRLSEVDSLTSFVSMLSMARSETDSCLQECEATIVLNRYPVGAMISNILLRSSLTYEANLEEEQVQHSD